MHRCKVLVPDGDKGLQPMHAPVGFQRQDVNGVQRLWVSVPGNWLQTLCDTIVSDGATYKCTYEVRGGADDGSDVVVEAKPITQTQLRNFCAEYADYLEIDPRHNFTVENSDTGDTGVLDEHNFVFYSGDLDRIEKKLRGEGLEQTQISLPTPHVHQLHEAFDDVEPKFIEALRALR